MLVTTIESKLSLVESITSSFSEILDMSCVAPQLCISILQRSFPFVEYKECSFLLVDEGLDVGSEDCCFQDTSRMAGVQIRPTQNTVVDKIWNNPIQWAVGDFWLQNCPIIQVDSILAKKTLEYISQNYTAILKTKTPKQYMQCAINLVNL